LLRFDNIYGLGVIHSIYKGLINLYIILKRIILIEESGG